MWAAYNGFGECVADGITYAELIDNLHRLGIDESSVDCFEVFA